MAATLSATVRMYRLDELGDCFLLTFRDADAVSRVLVDCGSFRNSAASKGRLRKIVADIAEQTGGEPLDVVVGTHQHNDHVSGFVHCEAELRAIGVEQVWLPWLDDPQDPTAVDIGKDHNNLQVALHAARVKLQAVAGAKAKAKFGVIDDILGFYGAGAKTPPALPADAVRRLKQLGRKKPRYLKPGTVVNLPGLAPDRVKVYVLGPPHDYGQIKQSQPRAGESYDHGLAFHGLSANRFLAAVEGHLSGADGEERQYPFHEPLKQRAGRVTARLKKLQKAYKSRGQTWRKINDDWLSQAESLALYLDTYTNNSSLVLALELVESGKVMLFAADAQTGNWRSWSEARWKDKDVSLEDLLARTVLYKVGHHGSHNATLVQTMDMMTHEDLACLIPVHKKDPNIAKANGWKMPARNLLKRLREKTANRVLQMDGVQAKDCNPTKDPAKSAWKAAGVKVKVTPLFIELEFRDS